MFNASVGLTEEELTIIVAALANNTLDKNVWDEGSLDDLFQKITNERNNLKRLNDRRNEKVGA